MPEWYQVLFKNNAANYDREVFTQGTMGETDFMEKELGFDREKAILDIGCGTGRHSVELARRGYRVTGVDLSEKQLERAKEKAKTAGVTVDFRKENAVTLDYPPQYDLAMIICEGAFPLMETDEMNFAILKNAVKALKPGGKLILTTLNALFPLFKQAGEASEAGSSNEAAEEESFDLLTFRDHTDLTFTDDEGISHTISCNERYYAPSEIAWLLKTAGMEKVDIFGCELGNFSRNQKLTPRDFEMLVIAEKGK